MIFFQMMFSLLIYCKVMSFRTGDTTLQRPRAVGCQRDGSSQVLSLKICSYIVY